MNWTPGWLHCLLGLSALIPALAGLSGEIFAAPVVDPGRLFYTPDQRAQLEAARVSNVTQVSKPTASDAAPAKAPVRFDGMVIRSDGTQTSWFNGRPQVGNSGVAGLKPGQIRADGKVYEPYQVLRPGQDKRIPEEPKP